MKIQHWRILGDTKLDLRCSQHEFARIQEKKQGFTIHEDRDLDWICGLHEFGGF